MLAFACLGTSSSALADGPAGGDAAAKAELKLLFLGDDGPHRPRVRFAELAPALRNRGIELTYTDRMADLNAETLGRYDGLMLYANIDSIEKPQADAVLEYVEGGAGFVPLHCASFCWRNDPRMVALMGAQFLRHGTGTFSTTIVEPDHPVMDGFDGFMSWDETYVHHLHNEDDRTVLAYREGGEQAPGNDREPWTWVRTQGDGRVFYTAWGHDNRTFTNPGFQNLVARGALWACGADPGAVPAYREREPFTAPKMTELDPDRAEFEYVDVGPKIPNYTQGGNWGEQGAPQTLMQMPLSPEESIKHAVVPEGLEIKLYADERNFQAKPIAMTWDARGRLWVCETVDYPNELGGGRDRIRICEDTDGDAVADKFTVFADGLSIPTAIVIARDGAIVQDGTQTVFLKDTTGDDVADVRKTLITGWALGDTHGGVSNFRYGLDNWIWSMQGYNNSSPRLVDENGNAGDPVQSFRQGFWRFKLSEPAQDANGNDAIPTVTDLEFIRSTNNNTWGLGISEEGLIFGSTANGNPSEFAPIPNRYYERVRGWAPKTLDGIADSYKYAPITDKVRQVDFFGGYTAGAGHALYTARAFPQQWWNRTAFTAGPTGHLVGTFVLTPDGADFKSTSPINLFASDDEWTAPIMAEVGPDGAVWVLDWYNYIVQHNPTPRGFETGKGAAYESDLRDKKRGRILRIVPEENAEEKLHNYSDLTDASDAELVAALSHPSMRWRLHAQRLLIERNAVGVADRLAELVSEESVDEIGLNVAAIHALHTLHGLDRLTPEVLAAGLEHPSAGVRRNALALLPHDGAGAELLAAHGGLLRDDDAQVRLAATLALADLPDEAIGAQAGDLVAALAATETDPVLTDALLAAAAAHPGAYLSAALAASAETSPTRATMRIAAGVAEHVARSGPDQAALTAALAGMKGADGALVEAVLDGLTEGLPADRGFEPNAEFDAALVTAFGGVSAAAKGKLIQLASRTGSDALDPFMDEIVAELSATLADPGAPEEQRLRAARDLIGFRPGDVGAVEEALMQITAQSSPQFARGLLAAVRTSRAPEAGAALAAATPAFTPQIAAGAIDVLLSRPEWAAALLTAAENGELTLADLSIEQKAALRDFPNEAIRTRGRKLLAMDGGLPDADREEVLQKLLPLIERDGDPEKGIAVYKQHCAVCHKHGEMGADIGPNLSGMVTHPREEILTHIIDPSRSVESNFRLYTALTADGQILQGMLTSETRTSVTLVDTKGKETSLAREDLLELQGSRKSLMPEGFEKQMSEAELVDLLTFLTAKGKYVPIPLDKVATAVSTKGLFHDGDDGPDRLIFDDWGPKTVGEVPFLLIDPAGKSKPNVVLLNGPNGSLPPSMPESVALPYGATAKAIHLLSGVGGWNFPFNRRQTVSMIVRLRYADGTVEDHPLKNGVHFADYIRRVDVPGSEFAFDLNGQQIRYLVVEPDRPDAEIETIELVKGPDRSAPIVMAVTVEP
ncbi:PVC-type heme-binding CxxCH protein [Alienimonas sp. DA493]|uniref:PVC-type heme-binding CxxCH protein n=1 Tax=Alienimonas sp. DA493 TaxID=3373605 RepID=UPI003754D6FD